MTFFESLIALMALAVILLQVTRRMNLPYPGILAAAGVAVALVPGAPNIPIEPHTALALFIAPILIDAGYDFPLGAARRLLLPLVVYAVGAVVMTTGVVVGISEVTIGLPLAAAVALGAIVAPPDAAAATAVLSSQPVARRIDTLLKGESLFNDATALLIFGAALTIQARGGLDTATALQIGLAVPGGIAFGIGYGMVVSRLTGWAGNTTGATLFQFVHAFATWLIAERLHVSPVLATVASAMTIAAQATVRDSPRMRVHSFAVWTTVVFLLNVLAFLLMGLQAREIVSDLSASELRRAGWFAVMVVAGVIIARLGVAFAYRLYVVSRYRGGTGPKPLSRGETVLIGWTGMRGLVTLATAFALPTDFPERDLIVLTAFSVVLATLVIQGGTLALMIRLFGISRADDAHRERQAARAELASAALARLKHETGPEADELRRLYDQVLSSHRDPAHHNVLDHRRGLALAAILAQRARLNELRDTDVIGSEAYLELQEDLDWKQLGVSADEDRRIVEA